MGSRQHPQAIVSRRHDWKDLDVSCCRRNQGERETARGRPQFHRARRADVDLREQFETLRRPLCVFAVTDKHVTQSASAKADGNCRLLQRAAQDVAPLLQRTVDRGAFQRQQDEGDLADACEADGSRRIRTLRDRAVYVALAVNVRFLGPVADAGRSTRRRRRCQAGTDDGLKTDEFETGGRNCVQCHGLRR